jgi:hypothetical protein
MAEKMRYNKIIDLLEHGKPVFSTSTVPNGNLDDLTYIADADYDARAGPVRLNRFPRTISGFLPGSLQIAVFAAA